MSRIKKIIAVAAAAIAAVSLVGCNGGGMREYYAQQSLESLYKKFDGDLERGSEAKPITLHVLENDTAKQTGYLKLLLDGFNEKYKDYNIVAVDANQDQYSNLAEDGPYGYGPDVIYQANDMLMKYCDGKHITPLPADKLDAYEYLPELVKNAYTYSLDGTEYFMGVGINVQGPMMYYRKDLIPDGWETEWDADGNGVFDPIEDMRAMYRFSVARHAADPSKYGFMQSLFDPYFSCGYLFSYGAYIFGDGNRDTTDIGFAAENSRLGAGVILQLAQMMNSGCIDDSITVSRESSLASGEFFAVNNTQDMYGTMIRELAAVYRKDGLSASEAEQKATENIIATPMPALPASGDLTETDGELVGSVVMGGVNGYAVSSYTKYPRAALAFVNYASSYDMVLKRNEYLGISPARTDANADCTVQSDVAKKLLDMVQNDRVQIMPSVAGVDQIWSPLQTAYTDIATDPYRDGAKRFTKSDGKPDYDALQRLLQVTVCDAIYAAIYTLA